MAKLTDDEVEELIFASLAINDKLYVDDCGSASFGGSTNDIDDFRDTINHLWHRSCGWVEEHKSQTRQCIEQAQKWAREFEERGGNADPPLPDFMVPF